MYNYNKQDTHLQNQSVIEKEKIKVIKEKFYLFTEKF